MESLPDPPTDGITSLCYLDDNSPSLSSPSLLCSTSWDGCIRIHDTKSMTRVLSHQMDSGPLMSLCTVAPYVITGGLDGSVRKLDITTSTITYLGRHMGNNNMNDSSSNVSSNSTKVCCSCLASFPKYQFPNVIASAGWDSQFHLWDNRGHPSKPVFTMGLNGKAYSMDSLQDTCLVATSGRKIFKIDLRKGCTAEDEEENDYENDNNTQTHSAEIVSSRESSLKYQTRVVKFFPDGCGFASGSVEGRVAVDYLDELTKKKKYAFKCHRSGDMIYPVNDIAFHPRYTTTFATGGCDGTVVIWDAASKKRMLALPKFATSISKLAFNPNGGTEIAIASSYTYEEREREHPRDEIFIKKDIDQDCRPKNIPS